MTTHAAAARALPAKRIPVRETGSARYVWSTPAAANPRPLETTGAASS